MNNYKEGGGVGIIVDCKLVPATTVAVVVPIQPFTSLIVILYVPGASPTKIFPT
jgi:hypothetical protein